MNQKIYIILAYLALAKGSITRRASPIYSTFNNGGPREYTTPAPIYEESPDETSGSQQISYFRTLNVPFGNAYPSPAYSRSSALFSPAQDGSSRAQVALDPVSYATHAQSPRLLRPYSSPPVATTPGLSAYATQAPAAQNQAPRADAAYSRSSAASHASFTGFGTSYTW